MTEQDHSSEMTAPAVENVLDYTTDFDGMEIGDWERGLGASKTLAFKVLGLNGTAAIARETALEAETDKLAAEARAEDDEFVGKLLDPKYDQLSERGKNEVWFRSERGAVWNDRRFRRVNAEMALCVLRDWEGMIFGEGEEAFEIPYSREAAREILLDPSFYGLAILIKAASVKVSKRNLRYESAIVGKLNARFGKRLAVRPASPKGEDAPASGAKDRTPKKTTRRTK